VQQQNFSSFSGSVRHTYFHSGPFSLPEPDQMDPGGSLKSSPAPQQFYFGPGFETGPCCGTTMIHAHDVDTLDLESNM
jgi:hypothetical protein